MLYYKGGYNARARMCNHVLTFPSNTSSNLQPRQQALHYSSLCCLVGAAVPRLERGTTALPQLSHDTTMT